MRHAEPSAGAATLLSLADRIQGHARRLEHLATWRDVLQRNFEARAADEHLNMTALLRDVQARRFAGTETDVGFFLICRMAERHAVTVFDTNGALDELSPKMRAAEQRDNRFIGWLRRHGKPEMADLYVNDRPALDRRREAGRHMAFGALPGKNTDTPEGDTGLTEVVSGQRE